MKTLSARLQHALSVRGKSPAELARAVKKTESAVSQWLSGETKSMRGDNLMAVSSFLNCLPAWLSSGIGASGLDPAAAEAPAEAQVPASVSAPAAQPGAAPNYLSLDRLFNLLPNDPLVRAVVFQRASAVILDVINGMTGTTPEPVHTEMSQKSDA